jgi:hypothetical protein
VGATALREAAAGFRAVVLPEAERSSREAERSSRAAGANSQGAARNRVQYQASSADRVGRDDSLADMGKAAARMK